MVIPNPKPDVTRLKTLAEEYRQVIKCMQDSSVASTSAEVDALAAQRALLHDEIIAEFARLGHPVADRKEARGQAFNLVFWLRNVGFEA